MASIICGWRCEASVNASSISGMSSFAAGCGTLEAESGVEGMQKAVVPRALSGVIGGVVGAVRAGGGGIGCCSRGAAEAERERI